MTRSARVLAASLLATLALVVPIPSAASGRSAAEPAIKRPIPLDTASAHPAPFPTHIPLPDGFQPEGIAIGNGPFAYFGSRADGSIYRVNVATGTGKTISPGLTPPSPSVGMKIDDHGRLFVAGGTGGDGRVIDVRTGAVLARYAFAPAPPRTFVNDVILTPRAAYFTDSARAVLYKVPLGRHGAPADRFGTLALTGDYVLQNPATETNANGISRTPDGQALLIVQSNKGLLFRVDPATGVTTTVDVGAPLTFGDGLLLIGRTLYVVQNRANTVLVARLNRAGTAGTVVKRITSTDFDVPTTAAAYGNRLYLPNARFGHTDPEPAPYWVTAVRR
jgi:sugar lactone lactonase YvrE